jgi:uncharacterized protein (AIM24 family)
MTPAAEQGLFLKHFTAGKQRYDAGQLADAARDLEEAYLLRPRDHKVLNLLGLVYFKLEKLEKAEEIYRKLAAESPEVPTLYYNLGLIYFKLGRLEDAESAFVKALQLAGENPKIHFYLGSIYERLRRYQDAIYQYRQAGASVMVRRMEDRLAPPAPPPAPPPPRPRKRDEETAEFKGPLAPAPRTSHETDPFLLPAKTVQPPSPALMAAAPTDTRRFRKPVATPAAPTGLVAGAPAPPAGEAGATKDIVAFLAGLPATPAASDKAPGYHRTMRFTRPTGDSGKFRVAGTALAGSGSPAEPFRLLQPNLMEVTFSGKLFVKQGTIYSYSGNLTFWVKEKRPGGQPALVIISGAGRVLLTDREREISIAQIRDETIHVQPGLLLACDDSLNPRYARVGDGDDAPEFLVLEGRGTAALSVGSRSLSLAVTRDFPVSVAASAVIMWGGDIKTRFVRDEALSGVLAAGAAPALLRLEGVGRILMEQAF